MNYSYLLKLATKGLELLPKEYHKEALNNWYKNKIIPSSIYIRLKKKFNIED